MQANSLRSVHHDTRDQHARLCHIGAYARGDYYEQLSYRLLMCHSNCQNVPGEGASRIYGIKCIRISVLFLALTNPCSIAKYFAGGTFCCYDSIITPFIRCRRKEHTMRAE